MKKWISPNFDGMNLFAEPKPSKNVKATTSRKRGKAQASAAKLSNGTPSQNINLTKNTEPKTKEELAVHPKKISEVEIWLDEYVLKETYKEHISILLITGPTGCGKTTSVKVLCKNLGIDISEWSTPDEPDWDPLERKLSQTDRFLEFLVESKYPSLLSSSTGKKIVLIEDFPNTLIDKPEEFHSILERCFHQGTYSVVFICTDASSSKLNLAQTLFPDEIKEKYSVTKITFNPCPVTILKTSLKRLQTIYQKQSTSVNVPGPHIIDAIVHSSMGDIRSAVNQYQFACLKGSDDLPTFEEGTKIAESNVGSTKRKRGQPLSKVKNMARDETLGLFHSIGRVLNPKRKETEQGWRLSCNLDTLIDEFGTQPGAVAGFLHENYLKHFGDVEDVCRAADMLSQSQCLLEQWTDRHETMVYSLWTAVLGLMVNNGHPVTGWNPIHGPKKIAKVMKTDIETRNLGPLDYCFYNRITKSNKFHSFGVDS